MLVNYPGITGYQIEISDPTGGESALLYNTKSSTQNSFRIPLLDLTPGKLYQSRIRAFIKIDDNTRIDGEWTPKTSFHVSGSCNI